MTYSEKEIGSRIFQLRNKLKLSQAAFGHPMGIQQSSMSAMEKGLGYITSGNLASIAENYDVNLNWLYFGVGPMFRGDGMHIVSEGAVVGSVRALTQVEAPGLKALLQDHDLCRALELTYDETTFLSRMASDHSAIFRSFTKTGFIELLIGNRRNKLSDAEELLRNVRDTLPPPRMES